MYEYVWIYLPPPHTGFSKALWWALSEPKRRKRETTSEKHEIGMMGTNAEREQGVKGRKNRELFRVNTQEVERNIRLRLVFPLTLLSCSNPPPACFTTEQSIVKVSLFVNFHIVCSTVLRTFFLLSTSSIIKFWNTIRELITSSNSWVNDNYNKHNNACSSICLNVWCFNTLRPDFFLSLSWWCLEIGGVVLQALFPSRKPFIKKKKNRKRDLSSW